MDLEDLELLFYLQFCGVGAGSNPSFLDENLFATYTLTIHYWMLYSTLLFPQINWFLTLCCIRMKHEFDDSGSQWNSGSTWKKVIRGITLITPILDKN